MENWKIKLFLLIFKNISNVTNSTPFNLFKKTKRASAKFEFSANKSDNAFALI